MNNLSDNEIVAFFDKMSDLDLERIEVLAQSTRKKRRKKMKWVYGGETYADMKRLFE